ncbi:MAG: MFS transporter [Gemmatimonadales bacterium]
MASPHPGDATRTATLVVFVAVFIDLIGFGIVLPLLPSYAARLQASDARIGMLVASFSLMQFLLAPWWGRLSDRIGRRPVILTGLAGSAVSYLLFAVATDYRVLLLSRVVAGGMGATVNVAQAYLADVTPPERRARAMGLVGAAFGLGFVVGPAIGGLSSRLGEAGPGLVAAALTGANFVFGWFWLPETRIHPTAPASLAAPAPWKTLAAPFGVIGASTVAFTVMYVVFPLYAERGLHYSRHQVAYLFVLIGFITAIVQGGMVGRLVHRWGEPRLMAAGAVLLAVGLAAIPLSSSASVPDRFRLPVLLAALCFLGFGAGLVGPSVTGYVSRLTPKEQQGRALGALTGVGAIARVVGPIMAGTINQYSGSQAAFLVAAAAALAAGVATAGLRLRTEG